MKILASCVTSRNADAAAGIVKSLCNNTSISPFLVSNGAGGSGLLSPDAQFVLPVNIGRPAALNIVFHRAIADSCDYVVYSDDDATVVGDGWFDNSIGLMEENPKIAVIGPKIIIPVDSGYRTGHCNCRITQDGIVLHKDLPMDSPVVCETSLVSFVTGVFTFFRVSAIMKIGDNDLLFSPNQWEDLDYCIRAWMSDFRVVYDGRTEVVHHGSQGGTSKRDIMVSLAHTMATNLKYDGSITEFGDRLECEIDRIGRSVPA